MSGIYGGSIPLTDSAPKSEATVPVPGSMMAASPGDHQHPRLTSTTAHTLDGAGRVTVTFTRLFAPAVSTPTTPWPGVTCLLVEAADGQPVEFKVESWLNDANGNYTGCVIKGQRAQPLPVMTGVSGLLTAVITGINTVITSLTNYNVFGGAASGATFSCIAVQRS